MSVACSRRSDSGVRAKKKASERAGKKRGKTGEEDYLNAWNRLGCLGQVTPKNKQTKSGYTEPRPDGRETAKKCRCNWKSGTEIKNNVLNNDKLSYIHPIETLSGKKQKSLRMQPNGALGNTKTCLYS